MSAIIRTCIKCDRCGKLFGEKDQDNKTWFHRKQAQKQGWGRQASTDFCPDCKLKKINNLKQNQCSKTH